MSDYDARKANVGGEVLCQVFQGDNGCQELVNIQ